MRSKSQQDGLKEVQEELARIRAREKIGKVQAQGTIQDLEAKLEALEAELAVARENENRLSQEKKKLAAAAKEARQKSKTAQKDMRSLQTRLPGLEELLKAADFLRELQGDFGPALTTRVMHWMTRGPFFAVVEIVMRSSPYGRGHDRW